jgi:hypothetical protein
MGDQPTRRVQIVSAEFGDEKSRRTVTKSLQDKLNEDEDVKVNSSLIPWVEDEGSVQLTIEEQRKAKDRAVYECFGPQNEDCVQKRQIEIMNTALEEKKKRVESSANIVKGRRLIVKIMDGGKVRTLIIPEGQMLSPKQMGVTFAPNPLKNGGENVEEESWTESIPSFWSIVGSIFTTTGLIAGTFLYAVSILTTWQAFRKADYSILISAIPTTIAVLLPFSGFFITGGFFLITRYFVNLKNKTPEIQEWR